MHTIMRAGNTGCRGVSPTGLSLSANFWCCVPSSLYISTKSIWLFIPETLWLRLGKRIVIAGSYIVSGVRLRCEFRSTLSTTWIYIWTWPKHNTSSSSPPIRWPVLPISTRRLHTAHFCHASSTRLSWRRLTWPSGSKTASSEPSTWIFKPGNPFTTA